ncbi:MAG TPA: 3-phosphoshikimate 1-carboxyvinyltransferase, partial [Bacteroidales bacterium]|nr:3-phosphoshikimate 1-carboxyvinyltransferase [Bacteroidales bacterium]
ADGKSHIYGANRLTNKESSRAIVITEELKKANLNLEVDENMIRIKGANDFCYAKFDSHNDHRIAMALAIFGILSKKGASLTGHECVSKSYPDFYESLNMIVGNGNK